MDLLTTKLHTPVVRPDVVARPALLERLEEGLEHARPLTLVSAPAGYGKTTLIAAWLNGHGPRERAGQPLHSAWLSLADDDDDPLRFFSYLVAALQTTGLELEATAHYLRDLAQLPPVSSVVTMLLNQLGQAEGRRLLVLDDLHKIQAPPIHDALQFWLDNAPPNLHLVLVTREDPPLTLSRWRVRNRMTEIRAADLRFSREETAAFLNQTMNLALDAADIAALERRTEGWVAGLQLAAITLQSAPAGPEATAAFIADFSGSHRYVIDYLVEEVLRQQEVEVRAFLRQTAVLDRFCAPLCDALTGRDDGETILGYLEERNLFLVPLDHHRRWYRYHQLFADSLRAGIDGAGQQEGHRRAAAWFAGQELYGEAIRHAHAAGDTAEVARLVRQAVEPAFARGDIKQIAAWLRYLPQEMVAADPDFAVFWLMGLILTGRSREAAQAVGTVQQQAAGWDDHRQQGRLLVIRAWLADITHGEQRVPLAEQAAAALDEDDLPFRAFVAVPLGHAYLSRGQMQKAIDVFREGLAFGQTQASALVRMSLLSNLINTLNFAGRRGEAETACRQAIAEYTGERGQPLPPAGLPYLLSGWLHYDAGRLEQAAHDLDLGQDLLHQAFQETMLTPLGVQLEVYLHVATGRIEHAWTAVRAGLERAEAQHYRHGIESIHLLAADLHLHQGQAAAAWRSLQHLSLFAGRELGGAWDDVHPINDAPYLTYVRLLLAGGMEQQARSLLSRLAASARAGGRGRGLISILLLQATTARQPLPVLEEALATAAAGPYLRLVTDECAFPGHGPHLARLLRDDSLRAVAPTFVDAVLEALPPAGPTPPPAAPAQPAPPAGGNPANTRHLLEPLTDQEWVVVRLLSEGRTNQEIADELVITVGTAKWHVHNVYQKLDVSSRAEAVARIHEWNLAGS